MDQESELEMRRAPGEEKREPVSHVLNLSRKDIEKILEDEFGQGFTKNAGYQRLLDSLIN